MDEVLRGLSEQERASSVSLGELARALPRAPPRGVFILPLLFNARNPQIDVLVYALPLGDAVVYELERQLLQHHSTQGQVHPLEFREVLMRQHLPHTPAGVRPCAPGACRKGDRRVRAGEAERGRR